MINFLIGMSVGAMWGLILAAINIQLVIKDNPEMFESAEER